MNRRAFVAATGGLGAVLLAGCSGGGIGSGGTDDGQAEASFTGTGSFRLLISDQPAAIEDFDSLDVTLSSARIFRTGDSEEITAAAVTGTAAESSNPTAANATVNETAGEEGQGFIEFDLDSVTVDLTQVIGDRAVSVLAEELEAGRYAGIELHVASAEGVVDGEAVDVKVPSNRLRIIRPFEIGADQELDFVFDINVVRKGPNGGYNLLPVIGKSGVAGRDIEIDEVDN